MSWTNCIGWPVPPVYHVQYQRLRSIAFNLFINTLQRYNIFLKPPNISASFFKYFSTFFQVFFCVK